MPWPLSQDYNEAIQNPAQCFADPELRQGEADTNELGLPVPRSGNFADVYAVVTGQRKWAVKCFTRQIPGLQERYQQISLHLAQAKLPFMVDFTFLERGIRVRGDWYPVLKMQWVEGFTLNHYVKSSLDKPQVLDVLCQLWVKLAGRLRDANIAHCDLQHGNVLLVPGSKAGALQVKLVDYDGMCVPALALLKSIEVGHPAYQHPQRQREGIYNLEVDRFSHLVIYTALRALMAGGRALWDKHDDGDNLLFKPADYAAPTKALLFYQLLKSPSAEVRGLAEMLMQALSRPLAETPLLESIANNKAVTAIQTTAPARKSALVNPVAPIAQPANPFAVVTRGSGPAAPREPRRGGRRNLILVAMVLGVVALVGAAGGLALALRGGREPEPPALAERAPLTPAANKDGGPDGVILPPHVTQPKGDLHAAPLPKSGDEPKPSSAARPKPNSAPQPPPPSPMPETRKNASDPALPAASGKQQAELHIVARIDGVDDFHFTRAAARVHHHGSACPIDVKVNAIAWNLHPILPNAGKTRYLPDNVDFSAATLEKKRGRDKVALTVREKDLLVVHFHDGPGGSDVYEVRIKISPSLGMTIVANIDGTDELRITAQQLEWVHQTFAWPTTVRINGTPWSLESPLLPNSGPTRYLLDDVDFATARLLVKQAREQVALLAKEDNLLVVRFDDHMHGGSDVYDVVITMDRKGTRAAAAVPASGARLPVPDTAALGKAEQAYKASHPFDLRKIAYMDRRLLAGKLIREAIDTPDTPQRFVLFQEASKMAGATADAATAFWAIDEMAKRYAVDGAALRMKTLEEVQQAANTPGKNRILLTRLLALVDEAVAADRYDEAAHLKELAVAAATKTKSSTLLKSVQARADDVERLKSQYAQVQPFLVTLKTNPADSQANLEVGKFLCLHKGDWKKGLPLLAQGTPGKLQELAATDLDTPTHPPSQVKLADAWWDAPETDDPAAKEQARLRACHWYWQALPRVVGTAKMRITKRVQQYPASTPQPRAPEPVARWSFEEDASDSVGALHGKLHGDARIVKGHLVVTGKADSFMDIDTPPLDLRERTLEVWLHLANQPKGEYGIFQVFDKRNGTWDGIILRDLKWYPGSSFRHRSRDLDGPAESPPTPLIHVVLVYGADNTVTLYRNGMIYGAPYVTQGGVERGLQSYLGKNANIVIGQFAAALIREASLYNRALEPGEVAASFVRGIDRDRRTLAQRSRAQ